MQGSIPAHPSSDCGHTASYELQDHGLGMLFRDYGEQYIETYKPSLVEIKLIRSIRICRTPAMGGKCYTCKGCGQTKYIYFGCGNSRCPKCQGIKRQQWQQKLNDRLYACPYQHIVFTLPSELRILAKRHPTELYNILMRSAWQSLKDTTAHDADLGAVPGAIMVLHTFGSDLKYHVHVHSLVTFGGIDQGGKWQWPKAKNKIVRFRKIRARFRALMLTELEKLYPSLHEKIPFSEIYDPLSKKQWCIHQEPPTANADTITTYLSKYINRIGLSIQRFQYDRIHQQVTLTHKDYRKAKDAHEAPPMTTKRMQPLVAIHQIMQHCLPAYFQKTRYYGIHASASYKKHQHVLHKRIAQNPKTVQSIIRLISQMLGYDIATCQHCGSTDIEMTPISTDKQWIYEHVLKCTKNKDPSQHPQYQSFIHKPMQGSSIPMSADNKNTPQQTVFLHSPILKSIKSA